VIFRPSKRTGAQPSRRRYIPKADGRQRPLAVAALEDLLILSPLLLAIAIAIKFDGPGEVLFRQERVGRGGRPFRIFKFRSMVVNAPLLGTALTVRADSRITRIGVFLRRYKLDELPQLLNVLAGDMSLVGPRPEVGEFMNFYVPEEREVILSLRPGITDYAAILFRDESSLLDESNDPIETYRCEIMPIKFAYYQRYSHDIGLLNDLRIIVATIFLLVFKHVPKIFGIEYEQSADPETKRAKQTRHFNAES
jgi:lipopolysaccharide/colanic/teichoic acid biosynthesis glycosyltransferase